MGGIVGVEFRKIRKPMEADAGDLDLQTGEKVIVDVKGVPTLGTIVPCVRHRQQIRDRLPAAPRVVRRAEEADLRQEELNIRLERDYFRVCREKIEKHRLPMKLVGVDIVPDGSKVVFLFVADNRVDFRQLVKELAGELRTRIEMRQIGARSESQRIGGVGCCGRELCCSSFLQKFCPVTVKMTKEQGLPLDPEKISGVCGRLMCCLSYEYETYTQMKKGLPKTGKRLKTPEGQGKIRQINILTRKMLIELESGSMYELPFDDYRPSMLVKK